ncbi:MAG: hypothetical protein FJ296_07870 [Planctomycetes bacterium]|nr:hypothetical protein [Planctomycetota bacterium]
MDQPAKRKHAGYVLVVVLLLGGLIAACTAAWARHFLARQHTSDASLWAHESSEAAGSGVACARQRLASGGGAGTTQFTVAGHAVEVGQWRADADRMGLRVSATSDGLGATIEGEALVRGLECEVLPSLTSAAAVALAVPPAAPRAVHALPVSTISLNVPVLPASLEPGVAYTLVMTVSARCTAVFSSAPAGSHTEQMFRPVGGAWQAVPNVVPFALRGNGQCTSTRATDVTTQVRATLQAEAGATYVGSACVYSQVMAPDPWLGVVPGELPAAP